METINFRHAVREKTLNVGDKVWRYVRVNSKINTGDAQFFTDAYGADAGPTAVGFASHEGYKLVEYQVEKQTTVLESQMNTTGLTQYYSTSLKDNIKEIQATK